MCSIIKVLPHAIGFLLGSIGVSYAIQAFSVRGTQLLSSAFWMTSALLLSWTPPFLLVWMATFGLTVGCGLTETLVSSLTGQLATSPRMLSVFWGIAVALPREVERELLLAVALLPIS